MIRTTARASTAVHLNSTTGCNLAGRAERQGTARTYVWVEDDSTSVVAYFSTAPTEIRRSESDLPRSMSGGVSVSPGYLVARLALDRSLQGRGLGGVLLNAALDVVVSASSVAGGRLVVVDAIDEEAAAFYRHHEFRAVGGRRLAIKVESARKALGR